MSLDKYNNYLNALSNEHIVAFETSQEWTAEHLKSKVCYWIEQIQQSKEQFWILYEESPFEFLAKFLALNIACKTIILPANNQAKTIQGLLESYSGNIETLQSLDVFSPQISTSELPELNLNSEVLLYTSGSSGDAKKITKTLALLAKEIEVLDGLWGAQFSKVIATVSHQHLYGLLFRLLWPFFSGKPFFNKQLKYPEELFFEDKDMALVTSPAILSRLDKNIKYSQFAAVFSSGGPLSYDSAAVASKLLHNWPLEVYGSTETGGVAYRSQENKNSYWTLLPKVNLETAEHNVYIRSEFVMSGSIQLDDKISINQDGTFSLDGRKDRIIKYEEKRLSLDQLEQVLMQNPWVKLAKCLLLDSARKPLAVVIVPTSQGENALAETDKKQVVSHLKAHLLNSFELSVLPKKWRFVEELPTNSMNKVVLAELRELFI
ncbi:MAG: hypothetical protein HWE16_09595 [Gammaproteobacteria bacterium]|nr:hypothetical protein [Gammaproteobacteria bacterium]